MNEWMNDELASQHGVEKWHVTESAKGLYLPWTAFSSDPISTSWAKAQMDIGN